MVRSPTITEAVMGIPSISGISVTPATGHSPLTVNVQGQVVDQTSGVPIVGFSFYVAMWVDNYPTGDTTCISTTALVTTDSVGNFSTQFTLTNWPDGTQRQWTLSLSTSPSPVGGASCSVGTGIWYQWPSHVFVT